MIPVFAINFFHIKHLLVSYLLPVRNVAHSFNELRAGNKQLYYPLERVAQCYLSRESTRPSFRSFDCDCLYAFRVGFTVFRLGLYLSASRPRSSATHNLIYNVSKFLRYGYSALLLKHLPMFSLPKPRLYPHNASSNECSLSLSSNHANTLLFTSSWLE